MAASGVPESQAVIAALKSLGGTINSFGTSVGATMPAAAGANAGAQGTNAAQAAGGALDPANVKPSPGSTTRAETLALRTAIEELSEHAAAVSATSDLMATRLSRYTAAAPSADLSKCQGDPQASSLQIDRPALNFTASKTTDQSATFTASGGVTNYTARFLDTPTFGIELVQPGAKEGTFTIKVPKTVEGPHELTVKVEDSASPPNRVNVAVKVSSAPKGTGPGPTNQAASGQLLNLKQSLDTAQAEGKPFGVGSGSSPIRLTVAKVDGDSTSVRVALTCKPEVNQKPVTRSDAKSRLLHLLTDAFRLSNEVADKARSTPGLLTLTGDASCLK
jgi:hypothetical protein